MISAYVGACFWYVVFFRKSTIFPRNLWCGARFSTTHSEYEAPSFGTGYKGHVEIFTPLPYVGNNCVIELH